MIVLSSIIILGVLAFFIPSKYKRLYVVFISLILPSLFFFYKPPIGFDISRHYELLRIIRRMNFETLFIGNHNSINVLLDDYADSSQVYLIYAFIISRLKIDEILTVITGFIIYVLVLRIILLSNDDLCKEQDIDDWKVSFCIFFVLTQIDFRTITGIRNMLAYALFAYVLYYDLVRNGNKIRSFIAYFIVANIHPSVWILIIIRFLVSCRSNVFKWICRITVFTAYGFLDTIVRLLNRFDSVPLIVSFVDKINSYGFGGGTTYVYRRAVIHLLVNLIYILIYIFVKKKELLPDAFDKYGEFFLLFSLFSFGAITQYDIFVRSTMLMCFMVAPFLLCLLNGIVGSLPNEVILKKPDSYGFLEVSIYLLVYGAVFLSLFLYTQYYLGMDSCFFVSVSSKLH